jgi:hypothetical protein
MAVYRLLRGSILSAFWIFSSHVSPLCLAQETPIPVPEPPMEPADCPKFSVFPQLALSVVVSCPKDDLAEITLPLEPDPQGHSREKRVQGEYELREYHLPNIYSQEQAFDQLKQLAPMAGFVVKYSDRPSITARKGDVWILITVSGDFYTIGAVHGPPESCTPISDPGEISRQMQARNRVAVFGIEFSPQNGINQQASSEILKAVLKYIKENPTSYFIIESHKFSSKGTEDDDFEITRERANAIVDWLAAQGIPAGYLQVKPFGRMKPLTDTDDLSEIKCNDRIELVKVVK